MYRFKIKDNMEVVLIPIISYYAEFKFEVEEAVSRWFNDIEVTKYNSHGQFFFSKHKLIYDKIDNDGSQLIFAILVEQDNRGIDGIKFGKYVGNVSLQEIDLINRTAEIAIIIGEKEYWGKGIAAEAFKCMIKHGFERLNLYKIYAGTASENEGMIKAFEKTELLEECVLYNELYLDNKRMNIVRYTIFNFQYDGEIK